MAPIQVLLSKFLYKGRNGRICGRCGNDSGGSCYFLGNPSQFDFECVLLSAKCTTADVEVLDPKGARPIHKELKKRQRSYELNRHFQDTWAAKLPWAESVLEIRSGIRRRVT